MLETWETGPGTVFAPELVENTDRVPQRTPFAVAVPVVESNHRQRRTAAAAAAVRGTRCIEGSAAAWLPECHSSH